jgi:uncharacterized protein (DUF433 family)
MQQKRREQFDWSLYGGRDPRELPAYNLAEAAHYLKIPLPTVRAWVTGREYHTNHGKKLATPLIIRPEKKSPLLSFVNLVELHVLDALRFKHKVPLRKVRRAIDYLKSHHQTRHPLVDQWFQTDGVDLFVEHYGELVNVSQHGQLAMKEILAAFLHRIERDPQGVPIRLYPFLFKRQSEVLEIEKEPRRVVINPLVSFGRPVLVGTGIPTEVIADRFQAGDSIVDLAFDYDRETQEIEDVIRYEQACRQAA